MDKYKPTERERRATYATRMASIDRLMESIYEQCSLSSGTSAVSIWKVGEKHWESSKETVLDRVSKGIGRLPVIGLDSEGHGTYYQLGWVGETGLEAAVFGPGFFPQELMVILEDPQVYVV